MEEFLTRAIADYGALVAIAVIFIIMSISKDRWIMNRLSQDIEGQGDDLDESITCLNKVITVLDILCDKIDELKEEVRRDCPHKKGGSEKRDYSI